MTSTPSLLLCAYTQLSQSPQLVERLAGVIVQLSPKFRVTLVTVEEPTPPRLAGIEQIFIATPQGDWATRADAFARGVAKQIEGMHLDFAHALDSVAGAALAHRKSRAGYRLFVEPFASVVDGADESSVQASIAQRQKVSLAASDACVAADVDQKQKLEALGVHASRIHLIDPDAGRLASIYGQPRTLEAGVSSPKPPPAAAAAPPPLPKRVKTPVAEQPAFQTAKGDFWLRQALWGYCPPLETAFARHAPPTTFAGNDEYAQPSGLFQMGPKKGTDSSTD